MVKKWLILVYKIPREPTAGRVFVWRKLKQFGAIALQDAVWVLPKTARTSEQFQWLSSEITELKGECLLWDANQVYATNSESLERQFTEPLVEEYRAILSALKKKNRDLAELSKRYLEASKQDFFALELGKQTREKLWLAGRG